MKYYYDFKFGDKKLSDFGGTIYNSGDSFKRTIGGEPEHITLSIPNKGEIYYGTKLTPLQFEESVYFDRTIKGIEIANWICGDEEKRFEYIGDNKYCNAVYNGRLEFNIYGDEVECKSLTTIPFICYEGFWRAIETPQTIDSPIINQGYEIVGGNNIISFPSFKIIPTSSSVRFKWNDMYIALKDLVINRAYYLDGENGDFYYMNGKKKVFAMPCLYTDDYYTMPTLKPFKVNVLKLLEGSVNQVIINKNSRIRV